MSHVSIEFRKMMDKVDEDVRRIVKLAQNKGYDNGIVFVPLSTQWGDQMGLRFKLGDVNKAFDVFKGVANAVYLHDLLMNLEKNINNGSVDLDHESLPSAETCFQRMNSHASLNAHSQHSLSHSRLLSPRRQQLYQISTRSSFSEGRLRLV